MEELAWRSPHPSWEIRKQGAAVSGEQMKLPISQAGVHRPFIRDPGGINTIPSMCQSNSGSVNTRRSHRHSNRVNSAFHMASLPSRTRFLAFSGIPSMNFGVPLGAGIKCFHPSWVKATVTLLKGGDPWNDKHIPSHPLALGHEAALGNSKTFIDHFLFYFF